MTNWMSHLSDGHLQHQCQYQVSSNNPFNIIYIADWRATNSSGSGATTLSAIRLVNGAIPAFRDADRHTQPALYPGKYNTPGNANLFLSTNTTPMRSGAGRL